MRCFSATREMVTPGIRFAHSNSIAFNSQILELTKQLRKHEKYAKQTHFGLGPTIVLNADVEVERTNTHARLIVPSPEDATATKKALLLIEVEDITLGWDYHDFDIRGYDDLIFSRYTCRSLASKSGDFAYLLTVRKGDTVTFWEKDQSRELLKRFSLHFDGTTVTHLRHPTPGPSYTVIR